MSPAPKNPDSHPVTVRRDDPAAVEHPVSIMLLKRYLPKTVLIGLILLSAEPALGTQAHSAPEGLYAHQLAHIFFTVSMGVLIYWLRERQLVQSLGWRYIQYAPLFFILWNL